MGLTRYLDPLSSDASSAISPWRDNDKKGGGGGDQTITMRTEIPDFLKPLAESQAQTAQSSLAQLGGSDGLLTGDTLADLTPQQQQAMQLAEQRALGAGGFLPTFQQQLLETAQGRELSGAGVDQLRQTATGQVIDAPGFQSAFESSLRRAQPQIQSAFTLAGRSGGGLESVAQSQAAADAFAGLFNQERERQVGAASRLGGLRDSELMRQFEATTRLPPAALADVSILENVGTQLQQQQQQEINAPIAALERLMGLSGGTLSFNALLGQSQQNPPLQRNQLAGTLGGAASGASVGSTFGPWGAVIGGGAGALLGSGALQNQG